MRLLRRSTRSRARASRRATPSVPRRLRTFACLAQIRVESVRGLDLRAMNAYRWHPQSARFDPEREPHVVLSDAFEVFDIDLQARLRAKFDARRVEDGEDRASRRGVEWDEDFTVSVPITRDGAFNAAVRFEADMGHSGDVLRSAEPPPSMRFPEQIPYPETTSQTSERTKGNRNVRGYVVGLAAQYLGRVFVRRGETVSARPPRRRPGAFASAASPATPRTATIPTWHYDMLNDAGRNEAYDEAITCAARREGFARKRKRRGDARRRRRFFLASTKTTRPCSVIDAGSGSCLLAMFAGARAPIS